MNKNIEQNLDCTNIGTFIFDHKEDTFFRFAVYRKVYTPYEQNEKFVDESIYEDSNYNLCKITNVIETAGDVLLECSIYHPDYIEHEDNTVEEKLVYAGYKEYHLLSDIQLLQFDEDNNENNN